MGRTWLESTSILELKQEGEACPHQATVANECKDHLTVLGVGVY